MDKIIKQILIKIEENGFEAYLVGGYVRDYLLGKKSYDVDICTNALPKDLHLIFPGNKSNSYGGFNIKLKSYNIDITTYRKELKYSKRRPTEIMYLNSLEEDIKRRDFTINALCMNKDGKIIDLVNGLNDLKKKKIRMIGDVKEKLEEDPLRILRAIRFSSNLNFTIDDTLYNEIKKNYNYINNLSIDRIKQELNKILLNKNFIIGLKLLKDLKILDLLEISFDDIRYVNDICGMWSQLKISKNFLFTKAENVNIMSIRQIISKGKIGNKELYNYGLYPSLVAAEIMNINKKKVIKMYNKLPIKSTNDIVIKNEEIISLLNIKPSKKIKEIREELVDLVLSGKLKNEKKDLEKYIESRKEM